MQDFRNIEAWQVAHRLTLDVYGATQSFPKHELYGITSQLTRAATSIPTNIAEGCVKRTDADFARFLYHALGSASELEYLLLLAHDLGYISDEMHVQLTEKCRQIKRMLTAFVKRLAGDTTSSEWLHHRQLTAESRQP